MGNAPSSPLATCLNAVCAGRAECVAYPSTPFYQLAWVRPFNLDVPVTPAAVVRPRTAQDVSEIVKCAAANNVKVQAKSGGHSYANYGTGGVDGAVMIDLLHLQKFGMDTTTWEATVGAGTKLGLVSQKLHDNGRRAMAHGVCPGVGVGGHATVGGLGPMSRMWGTCLDHVVEVEVVTADGAIKRASETQNADLFYAIKGAGAGFGIITEFKFRTHPEPGSIVQYSYSFNFGLQEDMAPAYQAWQNLVADPNLDRRFSSQFIVQPLGAIIYATFYGTEAEYQATGIPARLPKPGQTSVVVNDWLGSLLHEAENEALWLADLPTPFYSKSLGLRQQDLLTSQGIVDFFRWLDTANKGTIVWFIIFDQAGGAINDVPKNATAYPHRDKLLFYQSYAVGLGTLSQETRRFLTDVHENIKRAIPGGCAACGTYVGYVDPALGAAAQATYWESNLPRLMQIKSAWDPKDVFRNPGSVRPA